MVPPAPLPQRHGVDPVRLRLPAEGGWATLRDHLVERLPVPSAVVDAMLAERAVFGADGPLEPDAPFTPGGYVWFHRELPDEVRVPFPLTVVHRDDRILVVDKPHFLAMTPRGRHVAETALARLRHELGLPQLSPAHRLDRLTAGLAMFVLRPELRGAYQSLFQERLVRKEYEALAPYRAGLVLPCTVRSRIVKERGELAAREVGGEPNSESRVELVERRGPVARYRLTPLTGRTHQLRLHMSSLGVPILADPLYPLVLPDPAPDDFSRPLQLLARRLDFTDPVTGVAQRFRSALDLSGWGLDGAGPG
ncbi:RluA family pseudouridine synthase [Kitasatospora kazusensis]|uniref:RNA pseudouridylate synthase n=1 Tax=Kitasatospora kazusensis TaxID=407974 RepID=A0ABP5M2C1_9ACTN